MQGLDSCFTVTYSTYVGIWRERNRRAFAGADINFVDLKSSLLSSYLFLVHP